MQDRRTCVDVYLDLVMIDETSDECAAQKTAHQELCCSIEEPEPVYVYSAPTAPPVYSGPVGDEPDCPICDSMEYPGLPNAFIVARYVGEYTCSQLYNRGFHGLIPNFMCGPLQDFAHAVCGCGQYNPRCQEDPTQCWDYIQQNQFPVPAPAPAPAPEPLAFERKTKPEGGKYGAKLSGGFGGAAARLRGGRELAKGAHIMEVNSLPELESQELKSLTDSEKADADVEQ